MKKGKREDFEEEKRWAWKEKKEEGRWTKEEGEG